MEEVPAGWSGPIFHLSHDYPVSKPPPPAGGYPWKQFDFRTQPAHYAQAVLNYGRSDLESEQIDWDPTKLAVPTWFHTPWMASGTQRERGREFIHGLTVERVGRLSELVQGGSTSRRFQNLAVGLYNDVGAWTIGRVWADPAAPDLSKAAFEDGAMSIKLLFTQATETDVPYLTNSKEWMANLFDPAQNRRVPQTLRLLQVDIAVRESDNDDLTGWVFGTFVYNGDLPGDSPFDRLTPVGLMWGNDPALVPDSGQSPVQGWINPNTGTYQHLGWAGRLNGPVDNPASSCLSCHSTAQAPQMENMTPSPATLSNLEKLRWFRNIRAGAPFADGAPSLDYSLQMAVAYQNWSAWRETAEEPPATPSHPARRFPVSRD